MSKVSISEAIRMAGISRSHFYKKYINTGIISVSIEDDKKLIDVSELIRMFGNIHIENNNTEQIKTGVDMENTIAKDKVITLLEQQLADFKNRDREAKERELWLQKQIDELRQQHTNLLENKLKKRKKILGIF
jgi:hypothetical protein